LARVNILKSVLKDGRWKLVSIPRNRKGDHDWNALGEGRYYIEYRENGRRMRASVGATVADAKNAARLKKHELEGRSMGVELPEPVTKEPVKQEGMRAALKRYLGIVEGLKKPNTLRKYRSVLNRFMEFFKTKTAAADITPDDLNEFMVWLKRKHSLDNNSVIHNMIIVAQFLKKQGRSGITALIDLPDRIETLPEEYTDDELKKFFATCDPWDRALFMTFLLTGFREQEVVHLRWEDVNFSLNMIKVKAKPELEFYPKRWEEREVPVPQQLTELISAHPRHSPECRFVFPSPPGNREWHMLDKSKAVATSAGLDPTRFSLRRFRSTYATRMLRAGFDVRTVQHWMGHKSLETTMRYLSPAKDVHDKLNSVQIAGVLI
jgi:integrase/recombinase XerD